MASRHGFVAGGRHHRRWMSAIERTDKFHRDELRTRERDTTPEQPILIDVHQWVKAPYAHRQLAPHEPVVLRAKVAVHDIGKEAVVGIVPHCIGMTVVFMK